VRVVPKAAVSRCSKSSSLDHLVGAGRQTWRDVEAKGFGGFKIDDELELHHLIYRQVGRLGSFENARDVVAYLTIGLIGACAVAHKTSSFGMFPLIESCRNAIASCQLDKLCRPTSEKWIGNNNERTNPSFEQDGESIIDVIYGR